MKRAPTALYWCGNVVIDRRFDQLGKVLVCVHAVTIQHRALTPSICLFLFLEFILFFFLKKKMLFLEEPKEMFSDVRHFAELAAASKLSLMDDVRTLRNRSAWLP